MGYYEKPKLIWTSVFDKPKKSNKTNVKPTKSDIPIFIKPK